MPVTRPGLLRAALASVVALGITSCMTSDGNERRADTGKGSDGPKRQEPPVGHKKGNVAAGKEVFRFETFGNEGFWTDAARMPKGIEDK